MPTVEIVRFPGSDAFVADPLILKDALDILVEAEGVINTYYGVQTEDGRTGYLIVIWETYEHHVRFKQTFSHDDLKVSFLPAYSGLSEVQHVDCDNDATRSLEAPTTEIALLTPEPGVSLLNLHVRAMLLRECLVQEETCHSVLWGESREREGSWFLVVGWDSMQAHIDAVSTGVFPEIICSLQDRAETDVEHTNLVKYTP